MSNRVNMMSDEAKPDVETERSRKVRQRRLGDQLRRIYEDVTTEPVPDEFLNLLEQADQSSNKK
ncbi:NepR family anti-sigma factor [Henriciella sp.]|uniref:NepR family anti-sigma factor n=1 Tax=Henriciella sp. TaxID=1968823 RepID=UPI002611A886|nr:NepR family anti-sigma factor [Henriciella sp.]